MDKITLVALLTDYEETYDVRNVDRSENFNCQEELRGKENDDTKNKVTSLEIIVRMINNKPYYEIKYKKVGEYYSHVGYSSFNIDNVLKWRDECFEIVDVKVTNADRIRNMSDEELAEWLTNMCDTERHEEPYKSIYNLDTEHEEEIHDSYGDLLKWLQAEVDRRKQNEEN